MPKVKDQKPSIEYSTTPTPTLRNRNKMKNFPTYEHSNQPTKLVPSHRKLISANIDELNLNQDTYKSQSSRSDILGKLTINSMNVSFYFRCNSIFHENQQERIINHIPLKWVPFLDHLMRIGLSIFPSVTMIRCYHFS